MSALEQIVRPFAPPQPFNTQRLVATSVKQPTQTAHVSWGVAGTMPTAVESSPLGPAAGIGFNTKKSPQDLTETSRQTEKIKVQQDGNPDNFVVIERIKKITFGQTPNTPPAPTFLTKPDGGVTQTVAAAPPVSQGAGGGDIPVVKQGGTVWANQAALPGGGTVPGYFQVGDRIFTMVNPPPGPNETLVP
jgi:hypothetical protein